MTNELKNRIIALSPDERALILYKLRGTLERTDDKTVSENSKRLVAYIRPTEQFDMSRYKSYLKERLPEYMIPSAVHLIDEIPTLPNGKVDRNRLIGLNVGAQVKNDLKKPQSEIEEQLVKIWEEVLNFAPISTEDNFFEIGGDSILSIQIISKARKMGIVLQPNQLFENQTIAELSLFAVTENPEPILHDKKVMGPVPLTPIQHWFFENHTIAPHFWNQIVRISNIPGITYDTIHTTVNTIISRHAALSLSFVQTYEKWTAKILRAPKNNYCHYVDLSSERAAEEQQRRIDEVLATDQQNCRLEKGELFRAYYFECGDTQPNCVYLIAHHLIVDMISWNIIFSDFSNALQLLEQGQQIIFRQQTASIKTWGEHLTTLSNSDVFEKEIAYWKLQHYESNSLPRDFEISKEVFEESSCAMYHSFLNKEETGLLLNQANEAYNTKVDDLLISALLKTICEWANLPRFCLGLERLGRTADFISLDVSDTVGWLTSFFPITLNYEAGDNEDLLIKSVKEQLHTVPNGGIGYGLLRYLSNNKQHKSLLKQEPEVIFNYLGNKIENHNKSSEQYEQLWEGTRYPSSERNHKLEINVFSVNNILNIHWSYCTELYKEETVSRLAQQFIGNLKNILLHCSTKEIRAYTPSDFPESGLNQEDLDNLLENF
ncbi:condensation domain-containing protein [Kriegella aquimaris]|uniref:Non-ribosomal peptide synthase domain TIGR01720 n=1 Tax=Kriegella aquimaris TaxID=192904 RepID=A0A1G9IRS2_9FLAO|nr:condensation domain-containing protein [Kriegella aquimaris]SDL27683.1 non-ribosomal peptide synthase domain TIGR01720 [Kriegella aquimaris]